MSTQPDARLHQDATSTPGAATSALAAQAWAALQAPAHHLGALDHPAHGPGFTSTLPVDTLAMDSVAVACLAVNSAAAARAGHHELEPVRLDPRRVATSFASDRHFRLDGEPIRAWDELSGFHRAADGWVRVHANYPHHAARLRGILDLAPGADADQVRAALAAVPAAELEDRAAAAGAVLVAVRSQDRWSAHPQAHATAAAPLISYDRIADASPRAWSPRSGNGGPLDGIRVLDLTRVIAGPVACRMLAHAGATVLRVDSPRLPEWEWVHFDTGAGKRSTRLDLDTPHGRERFRSLLGEADVLVTGYRPGALEGLGLSDEQLAAAHPGLVIGRIAAWNEDGPWGTRRGFDSIVQAATGIAVYEGSAERPGALPVQALDHSAGYLLAAGLVRALVDQRTEGGTYRVKVTLDRMATELVRRRGAPAWPAPPAASAPSVVCGRIGGHDVQCAAPAASFSGSGERWPRLAVPWGSDSPTWE